jgi:hypothetical protein
MVQCVALLHFPSSCTGETKLERCTIALATGKSGFRNHGFWVLCSSLLCRVRSQSNSCGRYFFSFPSFYPMAASRVCIFPLSSCRSVICLAGCLGPRCLVITSSASVISTLSFLHPGGKKNDSLLITPYPSLGVTRTGNHQGAKTYSSNLQRIWELLNRPQNTDQEWVSLFLRFPESPWERFV